MFLGRQVFTEVINFVNYRIILYNIFIPRNLLVT